MTNPKLDSIRSGVLRRMEQHGRHVQLAIAGGVTSSC